MVHPGGKHRARTSLMREKPQILNRHTLARTRLFHIEELELRFANGVVTHFERLLSPAAGAVLVVPLLEDGTVLLVREYAAGVDRYELSFPKGRIEPGEEILAAAQREMTEEIGHGARQLRHITSMTLAPGYIGHQTHVVLAQQLYPECSEGDEPEEIEVVPWPLKNVSELLLRDDFTEARSIAALFMIRELVQNG
jgi:ADP-ribose diphosphatase